MAEYTLYCFARSGVILDVLARRLNRFGPNDEAERREILRWTLFDNHKQDFPAIGAWLDRIRATPRWKHPYALMPGHPLPAKPAG